jgi:hypothetical protein
LGEEHGPAAAEYPGVFEGRVVEFRAFFFWHGGGVFLQGVLRILGGLRVAERGEFVVVLWSKRGDLTADIWGRKMCHVFQVYFYGVELVLA